VEYGGEGEGLSGEVSSCVVSLLRAVNSFPVFSPPPLLTQMFSAAF